MDNQGPPSPKKPIESGTPPRKRKPYFSVFGTGCLLSCAAFSAIILVPVFRSANDVHEMQVCEGNMRQISGALVQYQQDYDGRLPPSSLWAIRLREHARDGTSVKVLPYHCPTATKTRYGYALNKALAGRRTESFSNYDTLILLFESDSPDMNATGSSQDVVWDRHPYRTNYCYADGHAKSITGTPKEPNLGNRKLDWKPEQTP